MLEYVSIPLEHAVRNISSFFIMPMEQQLYIFWLAKEKFGVSVILAGIIVTNEFKLFTFFNDWVMRDSSSLDL